MPTQALLCPPALVDEIIAMVDQQLDLAMDMLAGWGRGRSGSRNAALATASASIGSDFPRVLPARRSGTVSFGETRTRS